MGLELWVYKQKIIQYSMTPERSTRSREREREIEMAKFSSLNTGAKIPSVGLGTYRAQPGVVEDAVNFAVKAGYRHIDCASYYGNERE
ncbi:uncharacterized protein A4U43_C08F36460, partial [Asparagus officinalis]